MNTENLKYTDSEHILSCPDTTAPSNPDTQLAPVPPNDDFPRAEKNLEMAEKNLPAPDELRIRTGSLLARLTEDQRTQLFKWLLKFNVADVLDFVAAPPPTGFGIQTHKTTLHRIKGMIRSHAPAVAFETSTATAELLTETIQENRPQFAPLISELLLQKAFDQVANTNGTHDLKDLINSAIKLRELELKVERLQILREKQGRPRVRVHVSPPLK